MPKSNMPKNKFFTTDDLVEFLKTKEYKHREARMVVQDVLTGIDSAITAQKNIVFKGHFLLKLRLKGYKKMAPEMIEKTYPGLKLADVVLIPRKHGYILKPSRKLKTLIKQNSTLKDKDFDVFQIDS